MLYGCYFLLNLCVDVLVDIVFDVWMMVCCSAAISMFWLVDFVWLEVSAMKFMVVWVCSVVL